MSLKEFTGLDHTKEDITNLPAPSWKHSTSPTSLINSYSARRRSVLATDMPSSPIRKLAIPKEECVDLSVAINSISALQLRLHEINSTQKSSSTSSPSATTDSSHDRRELIEESKRIVNAAKDFATISCSMPEAKWNVAVAEITDCAECLTTAAIAVASESNVYYSQLVFTELTQVLEAIHSALSDAQQSRLEQDDTLMLKSMTNLQSATNQLLYAVLSKTDS
ncbi:hypothetical protein KIN20_016331 [Parelaphostrongylus tenuis]|uniref:Uncharacterized protein n=1 Tax=Parelaphostrongylus tenuis TaxID=148309 RepID=A0AAD5QQN4_PARTN|nr:hypothetical protein KIN20_016331 [Parelaphostrongylus tenuis]